MLENEANFNISKDIQTTHIFNEYYAGDKLKALEIMQSNLMADSSASSKYNQILLNTLLKKAKEIPSSIVDNEIKNKSDALKALKANPLSENIIKKSVDIFNKNKSENIAYEALINSKKWIPESAEVQKLYILQCFKIHMIPYAKDGMEALKTTNQAEYKSFLPVYQAQMALVEKGNEGFN